MAKDKNWFLWRALASLVLVGLLIAGGVALHYAGWAQGYQAGQLVTEGEEAAASVYPPYVGRPFGFVPYLFGAGVLVKVVLLLAFIGIVGKLIRLFIWGAAWRPAMAGPWPGHWHRGYSHRAARWHRPHGPVPPWYWGWYGPSGEEMGEPDAEADAQA